MVAYGQDSRLSSALWSNRDRRSVILRAQDQPHGAAL